MVVTASERARSPVQQLDVEPIGLDIASSVVGLEDLYRQRPVTLTDALEFAPGAWTETRGRKVKQFTSFRGQTYPYPDYAVDGLWFREFVELPYFFPANELERIEVIRSSAALLKGNAGVAGVINLIPRTYEERHTYTEVEGGQHQTLRAYLSHHEPLAEGGIYGAIGRFQTESHEDFGEERMNTAVVRYRQALSDTLKCDANLFILDGTREFIPAQAPAAARYRNWREQFDPYRAVIGALRFVHQPDASRSTELSLWGADRESTYKRHDLASGRRTKHDDDDYEVGAQILQALTLSKDNVLRFGGLYHHWVVPDGKRFYTGRRTDLHTLAAVVADEQTFGRLTLDGGVRIAREYIDEFGAFSIEGSGSSFTTVEPIESDWAEPLYRAGVGGKFAATKSVSLYANYGVGQVEARRGVLTEDHVSPDTEWRHSVDAGLSFGGGWFKSLRLGGFYTRRDDAAVLTGKTYQDAGGLEHEYYDNQDAQQYGLEFECRSAPLWGHVSLFMSALVMDSRIEDSAGRETDDKETPDEVLTAGAYTTLGAFDASLFGKYVSEYENNRFSADGEPKPLGDYVDVNLVAGVGLGRERRTRVYGKLENFLDEEYSTVVGYTDAGRRVSAGIQHVF